MAVDSKETIISVGIIMFGALCLAIGITIEHFHCIGHIINVIGMVIIGAGCLGFIFAMLYSLYKGIKLH